MGGGQNDQNEGDNDDFWGENGLPGLGEGVRGLQESEWLQCLVDNGEAQRLVREGQEQPRVLKGGAEYPVQVEGGARTFNLCCLKSVSFGGIIGLGGWVGQERDPSGPEGAGQGGI